MLKDLQFIGMMFSNSFVIYGFNLLVRNKLQKIIFFFLLDSLIIVIGVKRIDRVKQLSIQINFGSSSAGAIS